MPRTPVPPDSIAGRAHPVAPRFDCSWTDGDLNTAEVDRVFALTGNTSDVEDGDVAPVDPAVQTLPRPGDTDDAS